MFDDGVEISAVNAVGEADGQNHVIEGAGRREIRTDDAAIDLRDDVIGFDSDFVEHGTEQRGLVFAIAVLVLEDGGSRMGLESADADFDGDVTDLALHRNR